MQKLTSTRWLLNTALTFAVVICSVFAVDYALDPYGLLRDPTGRKLPILLSDNRVKFLMNKRYIPTNFDGLLLGPSTSVNWDPSSIPGVHMYNESLGGGNAAEQLLYMQQALPRGHFKLAILVLQRTMTSTHDLKDGLDKVSSGEALGSIHLLAHEALMVRQLLHIPFHAALSTNGSRPMRETHQVIPVVVTPENFTLDPTAITDYQTIVRMMQSRSIRVLYIATPLYLPCQADMYDQGQTAAYLQNMHDLLPAAPLINFNQPQFDAFRSDPTNFNDCVHLNTKGAQKMNAMLAELVPKMTSY
jgi:hypothetical protein